MWLNFGVTVYRTLGSLLLSKYNMAFAFWSKGDFVIQLPTHKPYLFAPNS